MSLDSASRPSLLAVRPRNGRVGGGGDGGDSWDGDDGGDGDDCGGVDDCVDGDDDDDDEDGAKPVNVVLAELSTAAA